MLFQTLQKLLIKSEIVFSYDIVFEFVYSFIF